MKKYVQMEGKFSFICIAKKFAKGGGIHIMKRHFAEVKGDIGPYKSIHLDVKYQMENSLQEFVKSKKIAYEIKNPYGPNVSRFEGDEQQGKEEVQQMQHPPRPKISGKRKKINNG